MREVHDKLIAEGFERVERDDRLLDVFPHEISEKGIELWDKWDADTVEIVRVYLQKSEKDRTRHTFPRKDIENALRNNYQMQLG